MAGRLLNCFLRCVSTTGLAQSRGSAAAASAVRARERRLARRHQHMQRVFSPALRSRCYYRFPEFNDTSCARPLDSRCSIHAPLSLACEIIIIIFFFHFFYYYFFYLFLFYFSLSCAVAALVSIISARSLERTFPTVTLGSRASAAGSRGKKELRCFSPWRGGRGAER